MRAYVSAMGGAVLTYAIVAHFGRLGLLASLPIFAALPFGWHRLKRRWRLRSGLRRRNS